MGDVHLQDFNKTFGELLAHTSTLNKPLTEIGALMVSEMQENIRVGGRPEQWVPSQRAKREGGMTLADTGTLMRGIIAEVGERSVAVGPTMMGKNHLTDSRAMALLAFGGDVQRYSRSELFVRERSVRDKNRGQFKRGTKAGRGNTIGAHIAHYPARNYLYIPPDVFKTFGEILQRYLTS